MYELFYQSGVKGWISLGVQTATTNELTYRNIPEGALLWLRNLTRGKEEQVFYIEMENRGLWDMNESVFLFLRVVIDSCFEFMRKYTLK